MFEVKITLDCTSKLESAMTRLAEMLIPVLNGDFNNVPAMAPAEPGTAVSAAQEGTAPGPTPVATAAKPEPAKATPAPTASTAKPKYTVAQIGKAGAALIQANPANYSALQALMAEYNLKDITKLPEDKLDEFAGRLIELGADL